MSEEKSLHECIACGFITEMWVHCKICGFYYCDDCIGDDYDLHEEDGEQ